MESSRPSPPPPPSPTVSSLCLSPPWPCVCVAVPVPPNDDDVNDEKNPCWILRRQHQRLPRTTQGPILRWNTTPRLPPRFTNPPILNDLHGINGICCKRTLRLGYRRTDGLVVGMMVLLSVVQIRGNEKQRNPILSY
jgi:hypothetical protein